MSKFSEAFDINIKILLSLIKKKTTSCYPIFTMFTFTYLGGFAHGILSV